jgi:cysteinyl-tRNA synthetase, unknown class
LVIASSSNREFAKSMLKFVALAAALFASPLPAAAQVADAPPPPLRSAKSWGYQLQNVEPATLAQSPYDLFVLDYSRDGSQDGALTPDDLRKLKVKPDGSRRIVLSYFSIGEAEKYRYYWRWYWGWFFGWLGPEWLGKQNREWGGNYGARYWNEDWQKIIFRGENSYLDRIMNAGFDGVYLDKVDEYEDMRAEKPDARALMIALVKAIGDKARARKSGFFIVPQNGEGLLTDAGYRAAIDGLGKEDLLYGELKDRRPNDPKSIARNVAWLKLLTADGKPVFAVEYLNRPAEIERARQELLDDGFVPHFADRKLEAMRIGDFPDRVPARQRRP